MVVNESTDFEHLISFLDDSPSVLHRAFAEDLRNAFEKVLRERLCQIAKDGDGRTSDLYSAMIDLHNIDGSPEIMQALMTTNYDCYIESALRQLGEECIDFGFQIDQAGNVSGVRPTGTKLMKLHGSLDWQGTWPTSIGVGDGTLWIPPGILKAKDSYPFSVLWGLARELLVCDVLRIVGCRLDANDWDLISLLFTTRHCGTEYRPYQVELIDSPQQAMEMKRAFPYLDVQSIFELEDVGRDLLAGFRGVDTGKFGQLTEKQQRDVIRNVGSGHNWFDLWLRQKAEHWFAELGSVCTPAGTIQAFLES